MIINHLVILTLSAAKGKDLVFIEIFLRDSSVVALATQDTPSE
jgi:hypothetical protein